MQDYEVHCKNCKGLALVPMYGPPEAGLTVTCSQFECHGTEDFNEPKFSHVGCCQDAREWVGAICTQCSNPFEYPRYAAHPDRESAPLDCRQCFMRSLGITLRSATLAAAWQRDLDNRTLRVPGSRALNTGGCPPMALRPDAQTFHLSTDGLLDFYCTKWGYEQGRRPTSKAYWHPSSPIVSLYDIRPGDNFLQAYRIYTISRRTGDVIADTAVPRANHVEGELLSLGPDQVTLSARVLIAAWDNNESLADAIDALRAQVK